MLHAQVPGTDADSFGFIIDNEFKYAIEDLTDPIWDFIDRVRDIKNQTFRQILTPRTEELIK